ncbi:ExeM/NucH family extracellular endonuclease [Agromyces sp. CFH 90414]|uniref:ExeM/NucH family extracellular endonuclease n=1 Tax=Agromyces agglutinans TaxID=2662258 RepID=A0A6I2FAW5_9MICO|nr:ExeM/NucH family extracellular endonuclease [Agromyces agglutinans]MRG59063.1 ExeM/NucH family extracellular endonuclease [Agromyces agglutinans]
MHRPVRTSARRGGIVAAAAASLVAAGLVAAPAAVAAPDGGLIISEVVEGSSNNKAVELFNASDAAIDLAATTTSLAFSFNGSATAGLTIPLTGSIPAGATYVVAHASASAPILAVAAQTNSSGWFNGDDAISLLQAGAVVDSFGQAGVDPGTEWGTGLVSTADNTLRRTATVCVGDSVPDDAFDPAAQWTGLATDTFDGLGAHTTDCDGVVPEPVSPVINEFSASTTGDDEEYLEVFGDPNADLSGYAVLEVEGDTAPTSPVGLVDGVFPLGTTDEDGRYLVDLANGDLENGTVSLLLVSGFTGAAGDDLDVENDGVLDAGLAFEVVDAVAVTDGGAGDAAYGGVVLGVSYDGLPFAPGGASRIPDGTDTDAPADWVRNDFDLAGIPGRPGTLVDGEAVNTPGAENTTELVVEPEPGPDASCEADFVTIGSVQGSGDVSPVVGDLVEIEGVVTGDFQDGGFEGYYVQDPGDWDAATSDGIFVHVPEGPEVAAGGIPVAPGDTVHVVGTVSEFFGLTEVTATGPLAVEVCGTGAELPAPIALELPIAPADREAYEGMRVTLPQTLTILETFEYGQFGLITMGTERHNQPTAMFLPGSPEAVALAEFNVNDSIGLDDGRGVQNPDPAIHPNGQEFTLDNAFRAGDHVTNATGVLDYRFDQWSVQPTQPADFESVLPRESLPDVGGDLKVASFNVLNYFTTLDSRGANTPEEFERQQAKIVAAISEIDADVVGLIEIENNGGVAANALAEALNAVMGAGTYDVIETGPLGTDVITTALIYKPALVEPRGAHAVLDTSVDPRFLDDFNRPALAQTFASIETGEQVTVVVNHLKSKGSDCNDVGDPTDPNGQGNCNGVRTAAAEAMVDWLAGDPTGQGAVGRELIIGDLNSYDHEDPIRVLTGAGYTDLEKQFNGEEAYSYVFDGQLGYLDYALAGTGLVAEVTGATAWHINSDEPSIIDYDMTFKKPAQDALFAPDAFRSSDHDPVIVGIELTPPDTTAPTLELDADPGRIWLPLGQWRTIDIDVEASDDSGDVTVELVAATAQGSKRAEVQQITDTRFRVRAMPHASYTFEYRATDASGNSVTDRVTVYTGLQGIWPFGL